MDDDLMIVPPDDFDFGSAPVTRPPSEAGGPVDAPEPAATPLEKILPEILPDLSG
jgi:hypothetical protein